ncbi:MAG TPA: cobaltochelatase subunit CobN [Nitrospirales bacterium]|nr:cobaltochelatase subunit CobN [Nitrospirales bacterium]
MIPRRNAFWHVLILSLFLPMSIGNVALAKTVVAIVSDRSAVDLAAGADSFQHHHPGHHLMFRSSSQLTMMSDEEVKQLLDEGDVILAVAIFGDTAARLERFLSPHSHQSVLVINSPPSLVKYSRDQAGLLFDNMNAERLKDIGRSPYEGENLSEWVQKLSSEFPRQTTWVRAKGYWQARGQENIANLIALAVQTAGDALEPGALKPPDNIRLYHRKSIVERHTIALQAGRPWIAILDHDRGDSKGHIDLIDHLCSVAQREGFDCLALFALWGESSTDALKLLGEFREKAPLAGIVSLQDFVIGGGEGRESSTQILSDLNVPVLKGLRLADRSYDQWMLSEDGLPWNSVHYRIAMPEIQGVSQPLVLATEAKSWMHPLTGLRLSITEPLPDQVERMMKRISRWYRLRVTTNADKHVAIVYYNHPPGRHNIGADNLDVPASLLNILQQMKQQGYATGDLPDTSQALLDRIQEVGVNLPEDAGALHQMAQRVTTVSPENYAGYFNVLPDQLKAEMEEGPLGYLHQGLHDALERHEPSLARKLLERVLGDVRYLLDGADHPARDRAQDLLNQLEQEYRLLIDGGSDWIKAQNLNRAVRETSIEGLRGWGAAPGRVMVSEGKILIPGIRFGNVFIGPQPPRGWELNEELLHANTTFPPTHQYWAFYSWLTREFAADAIIHLGRHSTYEFLPRHSTGVGPLDYSWHIAGEIPGIYPYIVDGVGEGIQAKRRGLAVMVSHLTPPLSTTELYDDLLGLRQLVETFEAADPDPASPARVRSVAAIREQIDALHLREELAASMAKELTIRGIDFDKVDDNLLVHETGHYLTKLQENYMPLGLHVFGEDWEDTAITIMMASIVGSAKETTIDALRRQDLANSPGGERRSLFNALNGGFVKPGKGNDPIRTPEVLPTGKNFHALDGSLLPTRLGFSLGSDLATQARADTPASADGKEAVILWGSDAVRDEGAMIAFGLDMLGVEPIWNGRGIMTGIRRVSLENRDERRDVVFISSGLFRDLYGAQLEWLDKAILLALDGASLTIRKNTPKLIPALESALNPLGALATGGEETLEDNRVAAHWVKEAGSLLENGVTPVSAGRQASLRIFGAAPGSYGAGVNSLVERSGAWEERKEVAKAYLNRMGHAYGVGYRGERMQEHFSSNLTHVEHTYLGRASNLYGLLDNNDAFDFLGGLSLAVETLTDSPPHARIVQHADPKNPELVNLDQALLTEFRGKFLNPQWLKPLMQHDYAGARTMGSEFLEYLWGWQVTNPEIITSVMWDEVKSVYLDDRYDIGLDEFLESGQNVHIKTNMLGIMLVAVQKGFWDVDEHTLNELSRNFAGLIIEHGLPGSGHTRPDHPVFAWIAHRLDVDLIQKLHEVMDRARPPTQAPEEMLTTIAEIEVGQLSEYAKTVPPDRSEGLIEGLIPHLWLVWGVIVTLVVLGIRNGSRKIVENQ